MFGDEYAMGEWPGGMMSSYEMQAGYENYSDTVLPAECTLETLTELKTRILKIFPMQKDCLVTQLLNEVGI